MRIYHRFLWSGALVCAGAALLLIRSSAGQYDPNLLCVLNLEKLTPSVVMYAQDYDERFPQTTNPITWHELLMPYVRDSRLFICPATFLLYAQNTGLGGKSMAAFPDTSVVKVFWDARPHRDRLSAISFLDGHVERGGVPIYVDPQGHVDTDAECAQYVHKLTIGTEMYIQDYDERLPPMNTQAQYQASIYPYVQNTRFFTCPSTFWKYVPNPGLSGTYLNQYPNPQSTPNGMLSHTRMG